MSHTGTLGGSLECDLTVSNWESLLGNIEQQVDLGGATVWYGKKLSEESILLYILRISVGSVMIRILVDSIDVVVSGTVANSLIASSVPVSDVDGNIGNMSAGNVLDEAEVIEAEINVISINVISINVIGECITSSSNMVEISNW